MTGVQTCALPIYSLALRIITLAFSLVLAFLLFPARQGRTLERIPWTDLGWAALSLVCTGYLFVRYEYVTLRFPTADPLSAMDIAVEFTTLSKTYAMPGWRVGFAVGNERLIHALIRVKSYLDYGAFTPIQVAAAAALNGPQDCVDEIRAIYKRRRDCLVDALTKAGWPIPSPAATMFAWAPIPEMFAHLGSLEFSKLLLEKAGVAVSPDE